nr:toll-like receptor 4 [Crassostrea gigas]XP_034301919.1 toll-like receptor 4 [Crassostrea gigas]
MGIILATFISLLLKMAAFVQADVTCTDDANCLYSYATTLSADCSSRDLAIPPCFHETSGLAAINLRNNKLDRAPDNMPMNIEFLDLSYNVISDKLIFLQKYKQLQHLNLDNNFIKNDSIQRVTKMPNLKFLSLKNNFRTLNAYPDNLLAGFGLLHHLRIDGLPKGNFADMFPNNIHSLKILDVSGKDGFCKISRLKTSQFDKFNLTHLYLSQCDLPFIEMGSLASQTHLQYLDVSYNDQLGFKGLQNIAHDLQDSSIKVLKLNKVHCTFGLGTILLLNHTAYLNKTSLEELYLDSNRLEIIETGVITYHLPKSLKFLSLGDNKLNNGIYDLEISVLHNLQTINTSFQYFSHANYFENCYDYRITCHISPEARVAGEFVHNVKDTYPSFMRNNSQSFLPKTMGTTPEFYLPRNLTTVFANDMKLQYHFGKLNIGQCNVTHLHFQNNFFNKMDGPLHGCNKIIYLDFSNNYCHYISPQAFQIQTQLEVLNFSRNYLGQSFQDDNSGEILGRNIKLAVLNLHDNKITTLPRHVFIHNPMIKILNVSHNRLDTWSVDLRHMSQLQHLDLSYNLISELNKSAIDLFPKHSNFSIVFQGNPISCSCKNLFFLNWINRDGRSRFSHPANVTCIYRNGSTLSFQNLPDILNILQRDCSSYSVIIILASSFICFVTSFIIYRIMYRYRWKILYIYYLVKRIILPKGKKVEQTIFYESDVFISYAEPQRKFSVNMARKLENKGLKVRIHDRDFLPGIDIAENITNAIHNSKRTVIVMTSHFLKSHWCMFELNMACMESIYSRGGEKFLLLILLEKSAVKDMPRSLLDIIESKSYLEYPDDDSFQSPDAFWANLEEAINDNE